MAKIVTESEMKEIHDLVTTIRVKHGSLDDDIRNLYNLIHVVTGEAPVRGSEFTGEKNGRSQMPK